MNNAHQPDVTHFGSVFDEIGIRGTPPNNLVFTNGQTSSWFGSGVLNKPIGDFLWGNDFSAAEHGVPYFAENRAHSIQISVHARAIPEPEKYVLVTGFITLTFVIARSAYLKRNGRD